MINSPEKSAEQAKSQRKENEGLLDKLRQNKRELDELFHLNHQSVFSEMNCLDCANCCKTTSPIFLQTDIDRIAKHLDLKVGEFIVKYLEMDEDGDFVLQQAPCTFLNQDNKCAIYDVRPKACSEYPHTNRKNMVEILDLTIENSIVCPAVNEIIKRIKVDS